MRSRRFVPVSHIWAKAQLARALDIPAAPLPSLAVPGARESAANELRGAVPRWKVDIDNDQGFSRFAIGTLCKHLPARAHR